MSSGLQVIRDGISGLSDVAVMDPATQPTSVGFNPCQQDNGRCQQLCFAVPDQETPRCACAHGSLLSNGVTCGYGSEEFLVFTTDATLGSLRLDPQDHSSPFPSLSLGSTLLGLDYDYTAQRLFFSQYRGAGRSRISSVSATDITSPPLTLAASKTTAHSTIGSVGLACVLDSPGTGWWFWVHTSLSLSSPLVVSRLRLFCFPPDLNNPQGVAYDWIHKRLYWMDYNDRNIQAMGAGGGNRTVVAQASRPKSIVVDPCYGYVALEDQ